MRISDWSSDVCSSDLDDIQTDAPDNEIARFPSPSGNQVAILFGTRDVREVKVLKLTSPSSAAVCVPCRDLWVDGLAWRNDGELVITARNVARGYAQSLYSWRIPEDSMRLSVAGEGLLYSNRVGQ